MSVKHAGPDFKNDLHKQNLLINEIKLFYFSVTMDKKRLKDLLLNPELKSLPPENQKKILKATANNPVSLKYPPPQKYMKFFLRKMIDAVEESNCEVAEDLLLLYTQILSQSDDNSASYCTYFINEINTVTVEENPNFVIDGTTGLRTWEASKYMVEWCFENSLVFKNRRVLELGSGVGFLGLCVMQTCQPSTFIFTDRSKAVLQQLSRNIAINEPNYKKQNSEVNSSFQSNSEESKIEVCYLDWNELTDDDAIKFAPDIVVGADIVYDPSCIVNLVEALHTFLSSGTCCAYIASTIRNEETDKKFRKQLNLAGLMYHALEKSNKKIFIYDNATFNIYKILLQM